MRSILGISAFYHDSAACILVDGKIVAAAQEERFTRKKHDPNYPHNAIEFVLKFANLKLSEIDQIVFFEKPFLKFERLLETYVAFAPKGFVSFAKAMPLWIKEKLFQKNLLFNKLKEHDQNYKSDKNIFFSDHHLSHAASAFFPSPFDEAVVLTADGVGEWATTTVAVGKNENLEIKKEIHFPHSLGLLYSAFTYYTGFKVNSGEYKVMGLAPYGEPKYKDVILDNLMDLKEDGSLAMDMSYFNYCQGLTMTNGKFAAVFGQPVRSPETDLTQFQMDVAASIQEVTEEVMLKTARYAKEVLLPAMRAVHPEATIATEVIGDVQGLEPATENEARDIIQRLTGQNGADVVAFGTEAGLFQSLGMSAVVCGPGSIEQAHRADEFVSADQLRQCIDMLDKLCDGLVEN